MAASTVAKSNCRNSTSVRSSTTTQQRKTEIISNQTKVKRNKLYNTITLTEKERLLESWPKELMYLWLALLRRKQTPTMKSTAATTIGTTIATITITEILLLPAQVHRFLRQPSNKKLIKELYLIPEDGEKNCGCVETEETL